jgi:hypothetical protein
LPVVPGDEYVESTITSRAMRSMTTTPASNGSAHNPAERFAKNRRLGIRFSKRPQAVSNSANVTGSALNAAIARSASLP